MTPQFADVSQFQPVNIDWQAYKQWSASADGVSRVAMRSSYGAGYVDANFNTYRAAALSNGIDQIIYYHYAYPQLNAPQVEANWQFNITGQFLRPQDILILDFEENTPNATAAWAYAWLAQQEANCGGKLPGIYASSAYILERLQDARLAKYPLWLANWQFTPDERPPCPSPWQSYEFVQYSDHATIPGIPGTVDADIFLGVEPMSQTTTIDLSNPVVATYFEATADAQIWLCKSNGLFLGHGMLNFYQSFGNDALCGLTHLGLPTSPETAVPDHPGVVYQRFERGVLIYDTQHAYDNPPGSGDVYMAHIDTGIGQDPRVAQLQAEINTLTQPAQLLLQLNGLIAQASTANAQIGTALAQAAKLSQVQ